MVCHGSQAHGAPGYPNLTDNDWIYGGTPDKILLTLNGESVVCQLGKRRLARMVFAAAEYVLSLSPAHGSKIMGFEPNFG